MEYASPAGGDGEPANRRWVLEQGWIKANAESQEMTMTRSSGYNLGKASPKAAAPMREFMTGIHSHAHFRYPVDGVWSDLDKTFQTVLDEIFGPDTPNSAQMGSQHKTHQQSFAAAHALKKCVTWTSRSRKSV
jgi:hypothetical protein